MRKHMNSPGIGVTKLSFLSAQNWLCGNQKDSEQLIWTCGMNLGWERELLFPRSGSQPLAIQCCSLQVHACLSEVQCAFPPGTGMETICLLMGPEGSWHTRSSPRHTGREMSILTMMRPGRLGTASVRYCFRGSCGWSRMLNSALGNGSIVV